MNISSVNTSVRNAAEQKFSNRLNTSTVTDENQNNPNTSLESIPSNSNDLSKTPTGRDSRQAETELMSSLDGDWLFVRKDNTIATAEPGQSVDIDANNATITLSDEPGTEDEEIIEVKSVGNNNTIFGNESEHLISVEMWGNNNKLHTGQGNDIITLFDGSNNLVSAGQGRNIIVGEEVGGFFLSGINDDFFNIKSNGSETTIFSGQGSDTIDLDGGNGAIILADAPVRSDYEYLDEAKLTSGKDIVTVNNSSNTEVYTGLNDDTIKLDGASRGTSVYGGAGTDKLKVNMPYDPSNLSIVPTTTNDQYLKEDNTAPTFSFKNGNQTLFNVNDVERIEFNDGTALELKYFRDKPPEWEVVATDPIS